MQPYATTDDMPAPGPGSGTLRLDGPAFAERYQAAAPLLWTLAAGVLADRAGAEDVLQEAAVIGLRKLDRFDASTSFTAWMGRIVRNVALNHARARRRRAAPTDPEQLDRAPARAPAAAVGSVDDPELFDDDLQAALRTLKPVARACLVLRSVLDLDYAEISDALGIPASTAMSHVHRARRALRERLEPPIGARREPR
jgi:RNA polymerase sigma-70 factor (ECF subfamily)